ncbi:MAG: efflux RND transporter periplasmic adaptor subunit, partial [Myxococcaceae bacterium]
MRRNVESVLIAAASLLLAASGCSKDDAAAAQAKARGPRPVAVRVAPVERGQLSVLSEHPGELFADAVDIAPRLSGRLVEVKVRLGDSVEKGQVVARLDDADLSHQLQEARAALLTAEANGKRAEANLELARTELARKAPLAKDELVSAQELSEIQARVASIEAEVAAAKAQEAQARARMGLLEEQRKDMRLVAPFDGTVAERRLDPGATVGPSTPVLR